MKKLYSSIAERLQEVLFFAKKWGLATSQQHFGELLGYTDKAYISSIFNGRKNPNDFILCIGDKFPFFNTEYIRSGQGRLVKEGVLSSNRSHLLESYLGTIPEHQENIFSNPIEEHTETPSEDVEVIDDGSSMDIPIIPSAIVDLPNVLLQKDIEMNSSDYEKLSLERIIKEVDIAYRVRTEKLAPYVNIGDILLLKQLKGDEEVRNSELHLLNTKHQGTFLRYTYDEGNEYRLAATNRAPETRIPKEKVTEIFFIICNISFSIAMPDYLANKQLRQQAKQITSLVDSVNNLVTATIDEGKRTDKVLQMLEKEIEKNANK